MTSVALVTVASGQTYARIAELTHPSLRGYADRFGLDFIPMSGRTTPGAADFEKLACYEILGRYERVVFLDTDVLIATECPNILDVVPETHFGAYFVSKHTPYHDHAIELIQREIRDIGWRREYFNAGVFVASRAHRHIFDIAAPDLQAWLAVCSRRPEHATFLAQTYLNFKAQEQGIPLFDFGYRFNHSLGPDNSGTRFSSHIIHCKGHRRGSKLTEVKRARFIIDRPWLHRVLSGAPFLTRLYDKLV